jgi:hypothetical protein
VLPLHHRPMKLAYRAREIGGTEPADTIWIGAGFREFLEPPSGLEPDTYRLRNGCAASCARAAKLPALSGRAWNGVKGRVGGFEPPTSTVAQSHSSQTELRPHAKSPWSATIRQPRGYKALALPIELQGLDGCGIGPGWRRWRRLLVAPHTRFELATSGSTTLAPARFVSAGVRRSGQLS